MPDAVSSPSYTTAVAAVARRALGVTAADPWPPRLRAALLRLHEGLTGPRALIATAYQDDALLRLAYLVYHGLLSYAKGRAVLAEVRGQVPVRLTGRPLRVLDVGGGAGSLAHAALDHLGAATALVTDAHPGALGLARLVAAERGLANAVHDATWRLPVPPPAPVVAGGRYDILFLGNVLNELFATAPDRVAQRADLVRGLMRTLLVPDGLVLLIEPGLRETSRDLLALRDTLLAPPPTTGRAPAEPLTVCAPCLTDGPCPALVKPNDWCHEARLFEVPPALRELSDSLGTDNRRLVFSYLAVRRAASAAPPDPTADAVFRLVSAPLVEKGKRVIWGCGALGRLRLVRLDRDASEANRAFAELDRGDRVVLRPPPGAELEFRGDGVRVGPRVGVEPVVGP